MGAIYIGTSGYSYTDWLGVFYPDHMAKEEFLSYYAERFPAVELNFSYYAQPKPAVTQRMVETTPDTFLFTVKAHQSMTHLIGDSWRDEAAEFIRGVEPLQSAGKLGAVILQFPFSFHYKRHNREYLAALCEALSSVPLVVEFRNAEWQLQRVYSAMEEKRIGYVCTDSPDLRGLPSNSAVVTSNIGYLRFHGRNAENWWTGDNTGRYDYLYSQDELDGWIDKIDEMAGKTTILVITFNNHFRGQAVHNAGQLKKLLTARTHLSLI